MIGYEIEVVGEEPGLVMSNPASMQIEKAGRVPGPEESAKNRRYCFEKTGELYIPSEWFRAALLKACGAVFKFKMGGKTHYVKSWLAGTGFFVPEKIPLGTKDYEVYECPAIVQNARILRQRPRIFPWSATFAIVFSDSDPLYTQCAEGIENVMTDIVRMAGVRIGVGDNRPSSPKKPGSHGRFLPKRVELKRSLNMPGKKKSA